MPNVVPQTTSDEHSKSLKARRVVLIDPSDGGALGSSGNPLVVQLAEYISGSNDSLNVLGTIKKPSISSLYSGTFGFADYDDVDILVKNSSEQLLSVGVNNKNASERFLWIKNKDTVITNGDTPTANTDIVLPIPASQNGIITFGEDFFGQGGMYFPLGITIGVSTSSSTFTLATASDHYITYLITYVG